MSSCDGVEFHHELLGSFWAAALGAPLLPRGTPLLKLHGDLPQAQRTAAFVKFNEVRIHLI
jgi:ATP-dependent RNA helicase DDX31/DBP7